MGLWHNAFPMSEWVGSGLQNSRMQYFFIHEGVK